MTLNSLPSEERNRPKPSLSGESASPDIGTGLDIEHAQDRPVPFMSGLTMRDLANAITVDAFRNGFIETLHTGAQSDLLADSSLSRITNAEMKKLDIETSARLAYLLALLFERPGEFANQLAYLRHFTMDWERHATVFELPRQSDELPKCPECSRTISSKTWQFCPRCGTLVT